ncbi:MAG: MoxR-like ATPase, partial [Limisphaerales bacterium]
LSDVLVFNAKTTSVASDLFYHYQAVKHFQYIQNLKVLSTEETSKSTKDFIEYQALGKAIKKAQEKGERSVVLIDEIDKAPRDFPNDILNELEYLHFAVPELETSFQAPEGLYPIIILTSNSEKNLPSPFLRRCVYYNIDFPNSTELFDIIKLKIEDKAFDKGTIQNLIAEFEAIRNIAKRNNTKMPATAEFISWMLILKQLEINPDAIGSPHINQEKLMQSYSVLAKSEELMNILEMRMKSWEKIDQ